MNTSGKALVALYLHRKGEQVIDCYFDSDAFSRKICNFYCFDIIFQVILNLFGSEEVVQCVLFPMLFVLSRR